MLVSPQPMIRKKPVKAVKPRPRAYTQSRPLLDAIDSIENMKPPLHVVPRAKSKPASTPITTIEEYISNKPRYNFYNSMPSSIQSPVATSRAFDEAYDYLFNKLSGGCNGLNIIPYPRLSKYDETGESAEKGTKSAVRYAVIVYVEPGLSRRWGDIEKGLENIFIAAAMEDGDEAKWHCEGIIFELWAASPPKYWEVTTGSYEC